MNLLQILSSKPHNSHYLNKYIKFINYCKNNQTENEYIEEHHICPKASDLFPEYIDLKKNKWNSVKLTARQHIIAHVMLWKIYGGSQSQALHYMLNVQNDSTIEFNNRTVPKSLDIRYAAKLREEFNIWRKGKSTYKDSTGTKYFLSTNDPIITELNLVGNNMGIIMSEESRQAMRDAKLPFKTVEIHFLNCSRTIKLFSDEFSYYIDQGWTTEYLKEDIEYSINLGHQRTGEKMLGKVRYATSDGIYYGALYKTDPLIEELGLIVYVTDKNREQWVKRTEAATEFRTGTNLYTNGIEEVFANEPPDNTWRLGRKPRTDEWKLNQLNSIRDKIKGSKTYTNGLVCMPIKPGELIPEGFYIGMKHRPDTVYSYTNKDKSVLVQFTGSHEVPKDLKRIRGNDQLENIKKKLK